MAKNRRNASNDNSDAPSPRGRGRGRGRGGAGGRAGNPNELPRGRGGGGRGRGSPRGRPTLGRPTYHPMQEIDVDIQQWQSSGSGYNTPRGRGRGSFSTPVWRGSSDPFPRGGRGRGRGREGFARSAKSRLESGASLSRLLYEDRPLLRPIVFVRSQYTATLFEEAEDIFQPVVESATQNVESHVPTATNVARVFSGSHPSLIDGVESDEEIEEVDFTDMGQLREKFRIAAKRDHQPPDIVEVEKEFTGYSIGGQASVTVQNQDLVTLPDEMVELNLAVSGDDGHPMVPEDETMVLSEEMCGKRRNSEAGVPQCQDDLGPGRCNDIGSDSDQMALNVRAQLTHPAKSVDDIEREQPPEAQETNTTQDHGLNETKVAAQVERVTHGFYTDTQPSQQRQQQQHEQIQFDLVGHNVPLGVPLDDEDDVIVYNAPNPRSVHVTYGFPAIPKPSPMTLADISFDGSPRPSQPRQINPLRRGTLFARVSRKGKGKTARKRLSGHARFGTFGAMMAEARLRQEEDDPRKDERRRGDSDVDWGDEEEEELNLGVLAEGMDLDPDLVGAGVTIDAMKSFVDGVSGESSQFITMDDLEDVRKMGEEHSDSGSDDSEDGDEEELISEEEAMLIAKFDSGNEEDEESSEEESSPRAGFQARLARLRKRQGKAPEVIEDEEDQEILPDFRWENESVEDYIGEVEEFIDANNFKIDNRNRVIRNQVFRAIRDGHFDVVEPVFSSSKNKTVPPELREQWETDRAKKAERKRQRELERLTVLLDPLAPKRGGKKSRKATIAAAKLDPSIEIPHQIIDMYSVEQQIRRFLADNRQYMALPPADQQTRKKVHTLANAFNLQSKSKNGASGRYTTLTKTKHSGFAVNEKKIASLMRGFKSRASYDSFDWKGKDKGKQGSVGPSKTRDGDVVGQTAPKINNENIGFRMLASMGWADGDTIGLSGGLDAPIAVVIKKTKLGLGAVRF